MERSVSNWVAYRCSGDKFVLAAPVVIPFNMRDINSEKSAGLFWAAFGVVVVLLVVVVVLELVVFVPAGGGGIPKPPNKPGAVDLNCSMPKKK